MIPIRANIEVTGKLQAPRLSKNNITFFSNRNPPNHPNDPYGLSPHYWHVFAARLAFVVVFEV